MDKIYNSFIEEDIGENLELCEVGIKEYVIYYLKNYYPKKFSELAILSNIPKSFMDKTSIMYIPDNIPAMQYNIGSKLFTAKFLITENIPQNPEITQELLNESGLDFADDAEKELTIKKANSDMMVMQRSLSAMVVYVWRKISVNWELPIDLTLKLHPDGKMFLESDGSSNVHIKCRKAKKFLFVAIL